MNNTNNNKFYFTPSPELEKEYKVLLEVAKMLKKEFNGTTYIIGGAVRDAVLGTSVKDIDVEFHGVTPDQLEEVLKQFGTLRIQGKSFGIYNLEGLDLDFALPRKDTKTGNSHRDFTVNVDPFIGSIEAARRRDFTFNALMYNVLEGTVEDHFGGLMDIKNKVIRHTDDTTFGDDPLRVLRGAQFAARFGFEFAPETKKICKKMDLSGLSDDRIYKEMKKALLKSNKPSIFFETLRELGHLSYWFPELEKLIGCEQNPKYHPEGDVWIHTMIVLDHAASVRHLAENPEFFMVSALCHDLGKPKATCLVKGEIHAYDHELYGVEIAQKFLKRINRNNKLCDYVSNMVGLHMKPRSLQTSNSKNKDHKINRMIDSSKSPWDLILLSSCDSWEKLHRQNAYDAYLEWGKNAIERFRNLMSKPQLCGNDLMEIGMTPGVDFKRVLNLAHDWHLNGVTKDEALRRVLCDSDIQKAYPKVVAYYNNLKNIALVDKITGKDLMERGFKPGPDFKILLKLANKRMLNGETKETILESL